MPKSGQFPGLFRPKREKIRQIGETPAHSDLVEFRLREAARGKAFFHVFSQSPSALSVKPIQNDHVSSPARVETSGFTFSGDATIGVGTSVTATSGGTRSPVGVASLAFSPSSASLGCQDPFCALLLFEVALGGGATFEVAPPPRQLRGTLQRSLHQSLSRANARVDHHHDTKTLLKTSSWRDSAAHLGGCALETLQDEGFGPGGVAEETNFGHDQALDADADAEQVNAAGHAGHAGLETEGKPRGRAAHPCG